MTGPLVGASIGRFGNRRNMVIGNFAAVLGLMMMALASEVWHIYLFYSALVGLGSSFGMFVSTMAVANDWFVRRRALAMSLLWAALGSGGLIFPPLLTWFISQFGMQLAWVYLGVIHLVMAVVVPGILIRNRPEDLGQVPDGAKDRVTALGSGTAVPSRVYQTPVDWRARDALGTPALWMIVLFGTFHMFTVQMLTIHQVNYFRSLGFSPEVAATALGLYVAVSIPGRLLNGLLGSRVEPRYLAAGCLAGFLVGIIILINVNSLAMLYLYAVVAGVSFGGLLVIRPVMLGAYFGRTHYAQITGFTRPFGLISAAAPLFTGLIYDSTNSYLWAFTVAAALLGLGMVMALLARPPRPKTDQPLTKPGDTGLFIAEDLT